MRYVLTPRRALDVALLAVALRTQDAFAWQALALFAAAHAAVAAATALAWTAKLAARSVALGYANDPDRGAVAALEERLGEHEAAGDLDEATRTFTELYALQRSHRAALIRR